jgi:hypothetical protein
VPAALLLMRVLTEKVVFVRRADVMSVGDWSATLD